MAAGRYELGIDVAGVDAIDIHTHVEIDAAGQCAYDADLAAATAAYFNLGDDHARTVDDLAEHYRRHNTAAVVFTIDAQTASGHRPNSIEELIAGAARNNDVLIPFGSVDPWSPDAVRRVGELVDDYGVRGFKFHPSLQAFEPNDRRFYPIYEAIAGAGVPALFHTGQTGLGSALPGGYGIKLRYSDPMLLDDVAADFPDLTIVMAHPAVPWVDDGPPELLQPIVTRPQRDDAGRVNVTTLLAPYVRPGRLVRLTLDGLALAQQGLSASAAQVARANVPPGRYRVDSVQHRGSTGGGEFLTTMVLRPVVSPDF